MTRFRITAILWAVLLALAAAWGYQFSRSWGNLGAMMQQVDAPESVEPSQTTGAVVPQPVPMPVRAPDIAASADIEPTAAADIDAAAPADLRQEAFELRRELSILLVNDQELYASLDELFDETDEEILRENLQMLRAAFLSEPVEIE